MTREEAIVWLSQYVEKGYCRGAFADAINTAISALREQVPVTDSHQLETVTDSHELTNADHIRSMTDEELATDLLPLFEELCEDGIPSPEYMRFWLKQPYKEDT